jgi:hypothetical protein
VDRRPLRGPGGRRVAQPAQHDLQLAASAVGRMHAAADGVGAAARRNRRLAAAAG